MVDAICVYVCVCVCGGGGGGESVLVSECCERGKLKVIAAGWC